MTTPTARQRLEAALARIDDPKGEGARACLTIYREQAKAAAEAADARAKSARRCTAEIDAKWDAIRLGVGPQIEVDTTRRERKSRHAGIESLSASRRARSFA